MGARNVEVRKMGQNTCEFCRHQRVCGKKTDQENIQEQVDKISVSEGFAITVTCREWESSLCNRPAWEMPVKRDIGVPTCNF
jgi:hypothetical protein